MVVGVRETSMLLSETNIGTCPDRLGRSRERAYNRSPRRRPLTLLSFFLFYISSSSVNTHSTNLQCPAKIITMAPPPSRATILLRVISSFNYYTVLPSASELAYPKFLGPPPQGQGYYPQPPQQAYQSGPGYGQPPYGGQPYQPQPPPQTVYV